MNEQDTVSWTETLLRQESDYQFTEATSYDSSSGGDGKPGYDRPVE